MEALIHLDTHVLVWLYAAGAEAPLSHAARAAIRDAAAIRISPIARLELEFLHEIERVTVPASRVLDELGPALDLRLCDAPFAQVVQRAEALKWTRDPFDRVIVAQASLSGVPLVTRDRTIHDQYPLALW